jgi:hypothetical protein
MDGGASRIPRAMKYGLCDNPNGVDMSFSEKQAVVTPNVPPRTMKMEGRLMKAPGDPPRKIVVKMSRKEPGMPTIVARSTADRLAGGETLGAGPPRPSASVAIHHSKLVAGFHRAFPTRSIGCARI